MSLRYSDAFRQARAVTTAPVVTSTPTRARSQLSASESTDVQGRTNLSNSCQTQTSRAEHVPRGTSAIREVSQTHTAPGDLSSGAVLPARDAPGDQVSCTSR